MDKYLNRTCSVCSEKVELNGDTGSIPIFQDKEAICGKCSGEGWRFCEKCSKTFNFRKVDYSQFKQLYSLFRWREVIPTEKYCSNECYNIELLDEEISMNQLSVIEVEVMKIHEEKTQAEKDLIVETAKQRIEELEGFKNRLKASRA
ncbi:hypothetical protein ABES03_08470 [Neobacillus rhizosphaerae]|uniref:hypothetical protein n=1 Tax=Neobacillus rhizosphaerae TaxID=2880965 RepID=UPI003D2E5267